MVTAAMVACLVIPGGSKMASMQIKKRDFLLGTGFVGMAGLAGIPSVIAAEQNVNRSSSVFNVFDFGAEGDGKTPDSEGIQKALEAACQVGGTVYFPAGRYLKEMTADLGEHGPEYVFANNVGCPMSP